MSHAAALFFRRQIKIQTKIRLKVKG